MLQYNTDLDEWTDESPSSFTEEFEQITDPIDPIDPIDSEEPQPKDLSLFSVDDSPEDKTIDITELVLNNPWGVYVSPKTGLAMAYIDPHIPESCVANPVPVSRTPKGFIIAGESIVAWQSPVTGSVYPALQPPQDDSAETYIPKLAKILTKMSVYMYGTSYYVLSKVDEGYEFEPLKNLYAFDQLMDQVIHWKVTTQKSGKITITVIDSTKLAEREIRKVYNSPYLQKLLPIVEDIQEVSQPYFLAGTRKVMFTKPGYNPSIRTMNLDKVRASKHSPAATMRWFKRCFKDYVFKDRSIDIPALLCQTISTYCANLMVDFSRDGTRGERYVLPISVVESNDSGSGKTMVMKMASLAALGVVREDIATKAEELEKIMVTKLRYGKKYIYIDEVEVANSKMLLTATTGKPGGRVLGQSEEVEGELHVMMSGCNIDYTKMMARRLIVCKMLTLEDPEDRKFTRVLEKGLLQKLRPYFVTFAYNLVKVWVDAGCPLGESVSSFGRFSEIAGGILKANGMKEPWERTGVRMATEHSEDGDVQPFLKAAVKAGAFDKYTCGEFLSLANNRGYLTNLDPENRYNSRSFAKLLKQWADTGREVCDGYELTSGRNGSGRYYTFKKQTQHSK